MRRKRFIAKKNRKRTSKTKILSFITFVLFSFLITFHYGVKKIKNNMTKEEIVDLLFQSGIGKNELLDFLKMNPTEFLFSSAMGIHLPKSESIFMESDEIGTVYEYVPDPMPEKKITDPLIYIYNTHQTEGYSQAGMSDYNIIPTVLFASYYLREKLNDYHLPTIVETTEMSEILRIHQWKYSHSYEASRYLMKDAMEKNPTLKYFIDVHRDSISYESSTTEYMGKKYAKVLFVIGKEHPNYEKNLFFANQINEKMKQKISTISRGVIGKEGKGVNGIYNQDMSPNTILIETGGQYNNIAEVTNTMEILAQVLKEYIEETKE